MNLLALVDSPDHVCCRYRIRAFAPALERAGWLADLRGLERGIVSRVVQLGEAARFDAVILQRKLLPAWQLGDPPPALAATSSSTSTTRSSSATRTTRAVRRVRRRQRRFAATVRLADTVVAGNDFLADCALRAGARVERRPRDPDLRGSRPLRRRHDRQSGRRSCRTGRPRLDRLVEHAPGPGAAAGDLGALGREVPGLRLRIICDRFPEIPDPGRPRPLGRGDEARQLAAGQIGVSWLPDDLWSRGKCGLKVLQYQAAGLPVVANPVGCTNVEMIRAGRDGIPGRRPGRMGRGRPDARGRTASRRRGWGLARRRVRGGLLASRPGPRPSSTR